MGKSNNNINMLDDFLNMSKNEKNPSAVIENSKIFFNDLMQNLESMIENKDYSKMEDTFKKLSMKLQNELEEMCAKYGVSVEEMQSIVNDPKNFKREDWNALQDLKSQMLPKKPENKEKKVNKLKNKKNWTSV